MSARAKLALAALAVAILGAGCSVDARVSVSMRDDGSGAVRLTAVLDHEAVVATEAGGGTLENRIRLDDLHEAGWTVSPWQRLGDGRAVLHLAKRFQRADEIGPILTELSGSEGPLRDMHFTRDHQLLSTTLAARGAIDLGAMETGITQDPDVVSALTAQHVDVAGLDQTLLSELRQALSMRLQLELPGKPTQVVRGVAGKRVEFSLSTSVFDTRRVLLGGLAIVLLLAAAVLAFRGWRRVAAERAVVPRKFLSH